jgi:hypothetical protein
MGLKLNGATSGSIEIDVPAVAGTDTAITIPATSGGEFIVSDSSGNIDLGPLDINGGAADDSVNIDGSGRLLVGTSAARTNAPGGTEGFLVEGTSSTNSQNRFIQQVFGSSGADGPYLGLAKTRSTSIGGNTVVQSGDELGGIYFQGADGSNFKQGASILSYVDGTPGTNDMPGRLVFSTTADGASSPTERMRMLNTGGTYLNSTSHVFVAGTTQTAGTSFAVFVGRHSGTAGNPQTGTDAFYVWSNGDIQNTNNQYTAISDIKLKENIVDAKSQWDDIKGLRLVNYNFKAETGAETHKQLGLIAQEVETVCPGLVGETADLDENGDPTGEVTKNVAYSVLYMKAVKALQEAMERIETLEAKVAQLEGGAA